MRLLLRSSFNSFTGYGNDACDIAVFLDKAGVDLFLWPTSIMPGIPMRVAEMLTRAAPRGAGAYDATLQFLPPFDIRVSEPTYRASRNLGLPVHIADRHYGWSMWEKTKLTRKDMSGHGIGRNPWRLLDKMFVTTPMNVAAFEEYDPDTEYLLAPCGIDPDRFPVMPRSMTGPTRFCMVGQLHVRKDPFVAIHAFRELKEEHGPAFDAELHLKTNVGGLVPQIQDWVPGIYIHEGHWEQEQLIRWYGTMHCYVGPSRGEGNLKPPMEFMATGGTAIVTNWSGPTNWLHPDVSFPLDYTLMPLDPSDPDSPLEARADKEHLKKLMWEVHDDRERTVRMGQAAAPYIRQTMGWDRIIRRVVGELMF